MEKSARGRGTPITSRSFRQECLFKVGNRHPPFRILSVRVSWRKGEDHANSSYIQSASGHGDSECYRWVCWRNTTDSRPERQTSGHAAGQSEGAAYTRLPPAGAVAVLRLWRWTFGHDVRSLGARALGPSSWPRPRRHLDWVGVFRTLPLGSRRVRSGLAHFPVGRHLPSDAQGHEGVSDNRVIRSSCA
jgi:hypothetical protein